MKAIKTRAGENYLTEAEERKLWACMKSRKGKKAFRDFVLLQLMRSLALRRCEALALNVGDVRLKKKLEVNERIAVKNSTGLVYISQETQDLIMEYIHKKYSWGEDVTNDAPLFISRNNNRLSKRAVKDIVDYWTEQAGVKRITPHGLRHTKAQRIMSDTKHLPPEQASKKLLFANKQLRHKSVSSTAIYTAPTREEMASVANI